MKLKHGECVRVITHNFFQNLSICSDRIRRPWLDFSDDGEAIIRRRPREDRAVSSLLKLEVSLFRNCHGCRLQPCVGWYIHKNLGRKFALSPRSEVVPEAVQAL